MNFKTLNVGCTQKPIVKSSSSPIHFCWDDARGFVLIYDGYKNLYKYSLREMREIRKVNFSYMSKEKRIQYACHSTQFAVYFVLCEDLSIYVLRDSDLSYLTRFASLDIKYAIFMEFYDDHNAFVTITNEQVTYFAVEFKTNLFRSTQYSTSISFECNTLQSHQVGEPYCWNKGYHNQVSDRIISTWDLCDVHVFDANQRMKCLHRLRGVGSRESIISSALFVYSYDYMIVGYNNGEIRAWKVIPNNLSKKSLTFTFQGHTRQVTSLIRHATEPKIIVSAGLDYAIKFWDIDTLQFLFSFRTGGGIYDNITLLSSSYFLSIAEKYVVSAGFFTGSLKFLQAHDSEVVALNKSIDAETNEAQRVHFVLKNNAGLSLDCKTIKDYTYSRNAKARPVALIYPPPVCKKIISLVTCPFRNDVFFLHIDNGGFCMYTAKETDENTVFYIERIVNPSEILDAQKLPFEHQISVIRFLDLVPPNIDLDSAYQRVPDDSSDDSYLKSISAYNERLKEKQLIAFGSDKGSIVFVSIVGKMDKIYTRFSFHRDEILGMCCVKSKDVAFERYLVSFSREGILKITGFTTASIEQLSSIEIGCDFDLMISFYDRLILTTIKGDFKIFSLTQSSHSSKQLFSIPNLNNNNTATTNNSVNTFNSTDIFTITEFETNCTHEKRILTIEVEPKRELILTAAKDNTIRIWSFTKLLLLQIKISDKLEAATFADSSGNIAFSYGGRISLLTYKQIAVDIHEAQEDAKVYSVSAKTASATMETYFSNKMNLDFSATMKTSSGAEEDLLNSMALIKPTLTKRMSILRSNQFSPSALIYANFIASSNPQSLSPQPGQQSPQMLASTLNVATGTNGTTTDLQKRSTESLSPELKSPKKYQQAASLVEGSPLKRQSVFLNSSLAGLNNLISLQQKPNYVVSTSDTSFVPPVIAAHKSNDLFVLPQLAKSNRNSLYEIGLSSGLQKRNGLKQQQQQQQYSKITSTLNTSGDEKIEQQQQLHQPYQSSLSTQQQQRYFHSDNKSKSNSSANHSPLKFPEIISPKKNYYNNGSGGGEGKQSSTTLSPEQVQRIYQPLTPKQEYVCLSALPKQKKEKQLTAAEKFQQERLRMYSKPFHLTSTLGGMTQSITDITQINQDLRQLYNVQPQQILHSPSKKVQQQQQPSHPSQRHIRSMSNPLNI